MPYQDSALICLNGHVTNMSSTKYPESNTNFCEKCGEKNISICPECNSPIRGEIHHENIASFGGDVPSAPLYCHNCGNPYPWTIQKIEAINEAIQLTELDQNDQKIFVDSIVDVTSDNPKTKLSALKIKKISTKIGDNLWTDIISPLIVDIASETAKKAMGL